jgi:photosystem II stability/assembly factor-like uncharacterized protein
VIIVGEQGAVLKTEDGGETWEVQPNVTSNSLQAVFYRGGNDLWVAGRGGSILKRSESLSTVKTTSVRKLPPILRSGPTAQKKSKRREPLLTVTENDDIPLASPPRKEN